MKVTYFLFTLLSWTDAMHGIDITTIVLRDLIDGKASIASGQVLSHTDLTISNRIKGVVISPQRRIGETIKKNEVILKLDNREYLSKLELVTAEVESAEFEKDQAEMDYSRAKDNFESGIISKNDYEKAKLQFVVSKVLLRKAKANYNLTKLDLEKHTIRAPFSGVLQTQTPEQGSFVSANQGITQLLDNSRFRIRLFINDKNRTALLNKDLSFKIQDHPSIPLELAALSPSVDQETGLIAVELFANPSAGKSHVLYPGKNVRVQLVQFPISTPLPESSIRKDALGTYVLFHKKGELERFPLKATASQLAIAGNMLDWELVVFGPSQLKEGDRVSAKTLNQ